MGHCQVTDSTRLRQKISRTLAFRLHTKVWSNSKVNEYPCLSVYYVKHEMYRHLAFLRYQEILKKITLGRHPLHVLSPSRADCRGLG